MKTESVFELDYLEFKNQTPDLVGRSQIEQGLL